MRRPTRFLAVSSAVLVWSVVLVSGGAASVSAQEVSAVRDPLDGYARVLQRVSGSGVGSGSGLAPGSGSGSGSASGMVEADADVGAWWARSFLLRAGAGGLSGRTGMAGAAGGRPHPWAAYLEERAGASGVDGGGGLGVAVTGARLRVIANSAYPSGRNDGAVWAGKGLTTALEAGARARWGRVVVQLEPVVSLTQNADFPLAPLTRAPTRPEYAYPWDERIDYPQRFGPDGFTSFDWGQSFAAVELGGFEVGFGTRNMWWGPAVENALIMSDNASGFPHAFAGTRRPVDIGIGSLEAMWVWGRLASSEWSTSPPNDRARFFTGAALAYSPVWVDGLSLGASRVFQRYVPDDGLDASEYFLVFQGVQKAGFATPDNPTGEDEHDQLASVFARWVFPESGLELYVEWARNDHSWDVRDFILEPEHSQAYTLGLQKAWALSGDRIVDLRWELTQLERSSTFQARVKGTYYYHHIVPEGYTHEGQILGAAVGPGGKAQHLAVDLYAPWGKGSVYGRREVLNNDVYYDQFAETAGFCCHDVPLTLGVEAMRFTGPFELAGGVEVTRRLNRYYVEKNDVWNLNVSVSARWRGW